jgi:acetyl-CoA acetyltransferase
MAGMAQVYVVDGVRTAQGKYGGALAGVRADDLAALVVREAVQRAGVPDDAVAEVVLGAANQAGEDNRNVARMAVLLAGLPDSVPGATVNRLCASGLEAFTMAARTIAAGEADLVLAGGSESMTRAPFVLPRPD